MSCALTSSEMPAGSVAAKASERCLTSALSSSLEADFLGPLETLEADFLGSSGTSIHELSDIESSLSARERRARASLAARSRAPAYWSASCCAADSCLCSARALRCSVAEVRCCIFLCHSASHLAWSCAEEYTSSASVGGSRSRAGTWCSTSSSHSIAAALGGALGWNALCLRVA